MVRKRRETDEPDEDHRPERRLTFWEAAPRWLLLAIILVLGNLSLALGSTAYQLIEARFKKWDDLREVQNDVRDVREHLNSHDRALNEQLPARIDSLAGDVRQMKALLERRR